MALGGRGVPENVTRESSRAASAGPIPLTRRKFVSEPKGPCWLRSAMMRRASTGPTPGSASSCSAVATSTSMRPAGNTCLEEPLGSRRMARESFPGKVSETGRRCRPRGFRPFALPALTRRAESTAASWPSNAETFVAGSFSIVPTARSARTDAPSKATLARKRRAFFSAGASRLIWQRSLTNVNSDSKRSVSERSRYATLSDPMPLSVIGAS